MNDMLFDVMPVVALRGLVVFPQSHLHFDVGRKKSIAALKAAMADNRTVFLVAQKEVSIEDPEDKHLHKIGVVATVNQVMKLPNSENVRVAIEGLYRAETVKILSREPYLEATVRKRNNLPIKSEDKDYIKALVRQIKDVFEEYSMVAPRLAPDVVLGVIDENDPAKLADYIAENIMIDFEQRYEILKSINIKDKLTKTCVMLKSECELLKLEEKIQDKVQKSMDQNQKEYYLKEQLKAISGELNNGKSLEEETVNYRNKIKKIALSKEHEEKLLRECDRLEHMSPSSPESTVSRNYLETVLNLPWNVYTKDKIDLKKARKVLDSDHFGMNKVKDRIIEMLAVRKLNPEITGQIICLVGPPGVGKTSIAKSIARAIGRKYGRISLGGVHDEAEIRGHRKTYIGSMPGKIISTIEQTKSSNPLILLDEIDKLGNDYKGDPASALLEVLDAEQNSTFVDHYIDIPFDLSKVLFITTANDKSTIPEPLLDRMEVMELSSYTQDEKFHIAKKYLIPKQKKRHGITANMLRITDDAINVIIDNYTRESGVRKLENKIAEIMRKTAVMFEDTQSKVIVSGKNIEALLGAKKFKNDIISKENEIGVVNGLAWTAVGGTMLEVEAAILDGSGKIELTGSLGDVMKESAKAAISYIRSCADKYNIDSTFYKTKDIHIHVPEGAVPKDGPSAGVTISTALLSALTSRKALSCVAMTGEISLRGRVMPIGGLREKTMAAYRNGIKRVVIPYDNLSDLDEVLQVVKDNIEFVPVKNLVEVFESSLEKSDIDNDCKKTIITSEEVIRASIAQ